MLQHWTYSAQDADGKTVDLSKYKGKVVLIVNVASQCGFTPQYKELAALYDKYSNQGFVILGFPCNQVGQLLCVSIPLWHITRYVIRFIIQTQSHLSSGGSVL